MNKQVDTVVFLLSRRLPTLKMTAGSDPDDPDDPDDFLAEVERLTVELENLGEKASANRVWETIMDALSGYRTSTSAKRLSFMIFFSLNNSSWQSVVLSPTKCALSDKNWTQ